MTKIKPFSYLFALVLLAMTGLILAQSNDPVPIPIPTPGVPADPSGWLNLIIVGLTPLVIAGVKLLVPKIPKVMLPFMAPFLGMLLEWITAFLTGHTPSPLIGAATGGLGVWLRELVDQIGKIKSSSNSTP